MVLIGLLLPVPVSSLSADEFKLEASFTLLTTFSSASMSSFHKMSAAN